MPLLRTATGCRCRKTLLMTAITRVRRSRGTPWRNTEFQTCELRTQLRGAERRGGIPDQLPISDSDFRFQIGNRQLAIGNPPIGLQRHETFGVVPLAQFRAV